jgi:hypothetical protein
MSKNQFLKPKDNNRFQFLDKTDEIKDNKTVKNDKKLAVYDSSNNSFTNPTKKFDRPQNNRRDDNRRDDNRRDDNRRDDNRRDDNRRDDNRRDDNRRDDNRRDDNRRDDNRRDDNISKPNFKPRERETVKIPEIVLTPELFPELISNNTSNTQLSDSTNFKDILNTNVEIDIITNENKVKPGFIEITLVNRKFITNCGPLTPSDKKFKEEEEKEKNVNYCMNRVVGVLDKLWKKHKEVYDSINGEGTYDELYYLPPVYGPEYDNDIEEEEEDIPYDEYRYEEDPIE